MQAISLENIETYEKFDQGEVTVMMTKKNEDAIENIAKTQKIDYSEAKRNTPL